MAKYILIGGAQEKCNPTELSDAIFANSKSELNFLICLFARDKKDCDWSKLFAESKEFFEKISGEREINFILVDEANFTEQVNSADIIYFSGGDMALLNKALKKVGNNWTKNLSNKIIIGTSASTDMLSKYNFDIQFERLDSGLGLVPIKTIVHFGIKDYEPKIGWDKAVEKLENYKEKLPVITLGEGEFFVFSKNK